MTATKNIAAKRVFLQVADSRVYLARHDLGDALTAAGITGFELTPLGD